MIARLIEYPLLLLFVVASIGYLIGSIKIRGSSLGAAAVLFTGLAFGAMDTRLQIPNIIFLLGLTLFVYTVGLSSGPAFFKSYKSNGLRDIAFILGAMVFTGLIAVLLWMLFGFKATTITGAYAGSTTNTAALASIIDYINITIPEQSRSAFIQEAVVGYSYSYPMGVMGGIIAIILMEKILGINYGDERKQLRHKYPLDEKLTSGTVYIRNEAVCGIPLRDLLKKYDWNISFGRIKSDGVIHLVTWDTRFNLNDTVYIAGSEEDISGAASDLGHLSDAGTDLGDKEYKIQRIFVSNPRIAGKNLASLNLGQNFDAVITRIRRGDIEMLAKPDTVLEMGDRIRFVARKKDLEALSKLFGDSYYDSSRVNLFSFGFGIGLGLLIGSIEFSFGAGVPFKLGYAGGPLIIGLILGALRRTGPVVWTLPYGANVTLQQLGLILLLASIGVKSGNAFIESFSSEALEIFLASSIISLTTAFFILFTGYKILKIPFSFLMGMVSNQPAILDFSISKTQNRIPVFGFVMAFPLAIISKIIIAQILFIILSA